MSGSEHPNATAYRRTADAFRARDFETLRTLVAEDVVWHVPGATGWPVTSAGSMPWWSG
jgi:hypothetical protein